MNTMKSFWTLFIFENVVLMDWLHTLNRVETNDRPVGDCLSY